VLRNAILWATLALFQGCVMARGSLIDEIFSAGKPERFRPVDVSQVVLGHLAMGTERESAAAELRSQGFEVKEEQRNLPGCSGCDPVVLLAGYTKRPWIPLLPDESYISIAVGFRGGKVASVTAVHTRNAF
jgi:hypothetical protein